VDFADLPRLDEGEFLNDQLIDFYLLYLFNQMRHLRNLSDKVYIFNTHFFSTLTRKVPGQKSPINYSAVARWTSKEDLFRYDYIVVPINQE
jgi:sentrin-specific protease 7